MSRYSYNRTAVYLVTTPPEFRPDRPWTVPGAFTGATLYQKNLPVHEARTFARLFNARQVSLCQQRTWDHSWMIVVTSCRPGNWAGENCPQVAEGGEKTLPVNLPEVNCPQVAEGGAA